MATSHFCNGEWRDGPVAACPRHKKLSKKQTKVYRGVGEPGGKNSLAPSGGGDPASSDSGTTTTSSDAGSGAASSSGSGSGSK